MKTQEILPKSDKEIAIKKYYILILLLSSSSLCSPHDRPMNTRDKVLRQGRDFNLRTGRPRIWQSRTSKLPLNWSLDARLFYRTERRKQSGTKVKRQNRQEETGK